MVTWFGGTKYDPLKLDQVTLSVTNVPRTVALGFEGVPTDTIIESMP